VQASHTPIPLACFARVPQRIYGDKLNPHAIPERFFCQTTVARGTETRTYQFEARHITFTQPLNVVCIVKIYLKTRVQAHVRRV
jgi:hypothetical protein